jgi:hypothetical protein
MDIGATIDKQPDLAEVPDCEMKGSQTGIAGGLHVGSRFHEQLRRVHAPESCRNHQGCLSARIGRVRAVFLD